jgi:hypothetical protein
MKLKVTRQFILNKFQFKDEDMENADPEMEVEETAKARKTTARKKRIL